MPWLTDSSADLSDGVLDRHHIALVPLQVMFGTEVFQDRVGLKPEEFYRRLRTARNLPTTSQPTPADFVRVFRDARAEVDKFDNLIRSGRVTKGKAWLAGMPDVKPILSLDSTGRIQPVDRVRGRDNVVPAS